MKLLKFVYVVIYVYVSFDKMPQSKSRGIHKKKKRELRKAQREARELKKKGIEQVIEKKEEEEKEKDKLEIHKNFRKKLKNLLEFESKEGPFIFVEKRDGVYEIRAINGEINRKPVYAPNNAVILVGTEALIKEDELRRASELRKKKLYDSFAKEMKEMLKKKWKLNGWSFSGKLLERDQKELEEKRIREKELEDKWIWDSWIEEIRKELEEKIHLDNYIKKSEKST